MSDLVSIFAICVSSLVSLLVILFSYFKDIKLKKESKIYQIKFEYYLELAEEISKMLYIGSNIEQNINKLFQKALILSSDSVIDAYSSLIRRLNETGWKINEKDDVEKAQKLLIECRKDLGMKTSLSEFEIEKPF
jgi:hypothetical protein